MKKEYILYAVIIVFVFPYCKVEAEIDTKSIKRAEKTLQTIYNLFSASEANMLRETYPFDNSHKVTYLAEQDAAKSKNQYAYLWPYSGSLSAVSTLIAVNKKKSYRNILENKVLVGLERYYDTGRMPPAYASYINSEPLSDRYYDDNIWIGIDFTDLYLHTQDKNYLDKAVEIWKFIESGTDTLLGGGIYWCEQKKRGKNTCSNAPGAVYALKLFEATRDSVYLKQGKQLYEWTQRNLQDTSDYLYYDNKRLSGRTDKTKYSYNSGQMLQAATLLYKLTGDSLYLYEARHVAESCYRYFFYDFTAQDGTRMHLLKKGNIWFTAVMLRGFIELYHQDKNEKYVSAFRQNLDYAWNHMREKNGLFNTDWSGRENDKSKWLLTQFAMVEMYARISSL